MMYIHMLPTTVNSVSYTYLLEKAKILLTNWGRVWSNTLARCKHYMG